VFLVILIYLLVFRFDFSDINDKSGQDRIMKEEEEDKIVTSLHTILRPFLLRRLKTDGKNEAFLRDVYSLCK
jgi:SNF2 family DNA or RNA helicase